MGPGGVTSLMEPRNETLKVPAILRYLKPEKKIILEIYIPREYPKISELPLQIIPWKIADLKINFVILEIINSISSLKYEEISFSL